MFKQLLAFLSKIFLFTGKIGKSRVFSFEKKLDPAKEKDYFEKIKVARENHTSDPEAEEILTKHNLRLVAHIAKKYKSNFTDSDDLISIGSIGLIKAVRTFNPEKARQFSSYASRCIENEMLMVMRHEKKLNNEISIETCLGSDQDGNELTIADTLCDENFDLEHIISTKSTYKKVVAIAKDILTPREYEILVRRYGLSGKPPETQRQVALHMQISRSYISRIESNATQKIKAALQN